MYVTKYLNDDNKSIEKQNHSFSYIYDEKMYVFSEFVVFVVNVSVLS